MKKIMCYIIGIITLFLIIIIIKKFMFQEEIESIMEEQNKAPELRLAQKTLAFEVVKDLHGVEEAQIARQTSIDIFSGKMNDEMPTKKVSSSEINILDLLVSTNLSPSKSEARRLVIQGGIKVNNEKVSDPNALIKIDNTIVSKGKKTIIKVVKM